MAYPLAIELDDMHDGMLTDGRPPTALALTAFAETIEAWSDEEHYTEAQSSGSSAHLGSQSLIPSGLFRPDGTEHAVTAHAIITGVVSEAERRTNHLTGQAFNWCRLSTYAMCVDVVAEHHTAQFVPGQVVQGSFWLVGHRCDETPTESRRRRRFWRP